MIVINGVEMVDVQEVARLARRTPETVRRWVWSGRLRAVKQGNKLFVAKADVPSEEAQVSGREPGLSLRTWSARLASLGAGEPGNSASDLVFGDRAERAGR